MSLCAPDDLVEREGNVKQGDIVERNVEGHEGPYVDHPLPLLLQCAAVRLPGLPQRHRGKHQETEGHVACGGWGGRGQIGRSVGWVMKRGRQIWLATSASPDFWGEQQ